MNRLAEELLQKVNTDRIVKRLYDMVCVPSPTGNARRMAEHFAPSLREIGLPAEIRPLEGRPDSPSVVARWPGRGNGPTLQLGGHMDAIHTAHAAPYVQDGTVYGRGSADMKSGLTVIAEVAQILIESGVQLPGDLLVTAWDLHEHPWGLGEGVCDLIDHGIVGDAVIVTEGPIDSVAIAGKGTTIFDITIESPLGSPHELSVKPDMANALHAAIELGRRLVEFGEACQAQPIALLGTETIFLSSIHGGDFFNRLPGSIKIGGTRRFAPGRSFEMIRAELQAIADQVVAGTELKATVTLHPMKEGFTQSGEAKIIRAVQSAHKALTGQEMPLTGQLFGADNEFFVNRAHVPCVCMGAGLGTSHSDFEWADGPSVAQLARQLLLSILKYHDMA